MFSGLGFPSGFGFRISDLERVGVPLITASPPASVSYRQSELATPKVPVTLSARVAAARLREGDSLLFVRVAKDSPLFAPTGTCLVPFWQIPVRSTCAAPIPKHCAPGQSRAHSRNRAGRVRTEFQGCP